MSVLEHDPTQIQLASKAQLLNLLNITVFPVIAFFMLLQHRKNANSSSAFVKQHINTSTNASIWAGVLMIVPVLLVWMIMPNNSEAKWMFIILYLVSVHSAFIILAVIAYARALGGRSYRIFLPNILA